MTPQQRRQLQYLLDEQQELMHAVRGYGERLRQFVADVEKTEGPDRIVEAAAEMARAQLAEESGPVPVHLPPPLPERAPATQATPVSAISEPLPEPAFGPPDERGSREPLGGTASPPEMAISPVDPPGEGASGPWPSAASPGGAGQKEPTSLEMTIGTVWLARIGIVILVTGLVFLGNFAYQHIIHRMGPGVKVTLLYLIAAGLGGLGSWLQKRLNTEGRFPQVLMAGAAATAYYTTYGMHFVARLRVIENPYLAGILLLLVGGLFVWWCDRRKLQTAALLGILLSYYTAAINPIGSFTVYSSAVLTAGAGLLLVRNGWAMVSWASLAGTYGSYVYWMLSTAHGLVGHVDEALYAHPFATLPGNLWFLGLYWLLFTLSVFAARTESFASIPRATFLTTNNALFFALASNYVWFRHRPEYWAFVLGYGCVLLALAAVARLRHVKDYALDGAYLVQGLSVITAGLALKLTGPQLATALAAESAVLLTAVTRRHGAIYRIGAVTCAVWAFCLTMNKIRFEELTVPLGGTVAALFIFDAWWLKQRSGWLPAMRWSWRAAGFVALGLYLIAVIFMRRVYGPWEAPSFAAAALVATASIYLLRLPELVLLGQLYLLAAIGLWLNSYYPGYPMYERFTPWWQPVPIILGSLALAHWWQRQRVMRAIPTEALHLACALGFVTMAFFWCKMWLAGQMLAVVFTGAGVATMLYGYATRAWGIAVLGQLFALAAIYEVFHRFGPDHFPWSIALLPIFGVVAAASILAGGAAERWPEEMREARQPAVIFYWLLTFALTVGWALEYIPERWRLLFFAALGAVFFLTGARWPSRPRTYTGLAFGALAFLLFWGRFWSALFGAEYGWLDLLALLLLPGSLRIASHLAPEGKLPTPWPEVLVGLTTASVWLWVTNWIYRTHHVEKLTVAWSVLAVVVFIAGLTLRDRIYRIGGFIILALAIGRIYLVDVWKLETVHRILSFMVLGIVLLALGFVYNKYADKIRRWL